MRPIALLALLLAAPAAMAQDTLRLPALHDAAVRRDPRMRQLELERAATDLRLRNIRTEWLPRLTASAEATHQSEVPRIPIAAPGATVPQPPKDRYSGTLGVEQMILDGGALRQRRAMERTRLAAESAQLAAELHPLRAEVNEAFFTAFMLQERLAEIAALTADLETRLAQLRAQVGAGAALPGDTAAVLAELLVAAQQRGEANASRRAALAVLAELVGRTISDADVLALPELADQVAQARARLLDGGEDRDPSDSSETVIPSAARDLGTIVRRGNDTTRHPQYAVFAAQREQLEREAALIGTQDHPQLLGFGQLGYGRPGLELFTDEPHDYWMAGVRVRWTPWTWGATQREQEVLRLRQEILDTEEAAFTERLRRQVQDELQAMERLRATLELDERIIALREQVERQGRSQLAERAITAAAYVGLRTDLQDARLDRQRHRVELARAHAAYLTTLGLELR